MIAELPRGAAWLAAILTVGASAMPLGRIIVGRAARHAGDEGSHTHLSWAVGILSAFALVQWSSWFARWVGCSAYAAGLLGGVIGVGVPAFVAAASPPWRLQRTRRDLLQPMIVTFVAWMVWSVIIGGTVPRRSWEQLNLALLYSLAGEAWPPSDPYAAGFPLNYHYGAHQMWAHALLAFNLEPSKHFGWIGVTTATLATLVIYGIARSYTRRAVATSLTIVCLLGLPLLAGDLRYMNADRLADWLPALTQWEPSLRREFPLAAYWSAIFHGSLWALPFTLGSIALAVRWSSRFGRWATLFFAGLFASTAMSANLLEVFPLAAAGIWVATSLVQPKTRLSLGARLFSFSGIVPVLAFLAHLSVSGSRVVLLTPSQWSIWWHPLAASFVAAAPLLAACVVQTRPGRHGFRGWLATIVIVFFAMEFLNIVPAGVEATNADRFNLVGKMSVTLACLLAVAAAAKCPIRRQLRASDMFGGVLALIGIPAIGLLGFWAVRMQSGPYANPVTWDAWGGLRLAWLDQALEAARRCDDIHDWIQPPLLSYRAGIDLPSMAGVPTALTRLEQVQQRLAHRGPEIVQRFHDIERLFATGVAPPGLGRELGVVIAPENYTLVPINRAAFSSPSWRVVWQRDGWMVLHFVDEIGPIRSK